MLLFLLWIAEPLCVDPDMHRRLIAAQNRHRERKAQAERRRIARDIVRCWFRIGGE